MTGNNHKTKNICFEKNFIARWSRFFFLYYTIRGFITWLRKKKKKRNVNNTLTITKTYILRSKTSYILPHLNRNQMQWLLLTNQWTWKKKRKTKWRHVETKDDSTIESNVSTRRNRLFERRATRVPNESPIETGCLARTQLSAF